MVEAWYFMAAALLALSGAAKIVDPEPTRGALRAARLPAGPWAVRVLGLIEVGVGAIALALGGMAPAAMVAALYLGFSGFVAWALARDLPLQSCGCFGRSDTPPSLIHLTVNLSAAGAALVVLAGGGSSLWDTLEGQPAAGIPYLGFAAVGTYLIVLILTELPRPSRRVGT